MTLILPTSMIILPDQDKAEYISTMRKTAEAELYPKLWDMIHWNTTTLTEIAILDDEDGEIRGADLNGNPSIMGRDLIFPPK